jgi:tripartite ATP-independent transporter DctM subunit
MGAGDGWRRLAAIASGAEGAVAATALLLMALLPVAELTVRGLFGWGVPGAYGYVQNLTLWVGFLGAAIAAAGDGHLSLVPRREVRSGFRHGLARALCDAVAVAVAAGLCWGALRFVRSEMESAVTVAAWLPIWLVEAVLPLAFGLIAVRFALRAPTGWGRGVAALGAPAALLLGTLLEPLAPALLWPGVVCLLLAALFGAPIFIAIGGLALLLFHADGVPVAAIAVETYRIAISPLIPTIPLFTLAGYILAEGGASRRLVRLFRALFGWLPGGLPVAATLVAAFFTAFTGGSGVTILALGGLLLPVLLQSGYGQRFSLGLITATGSIGLLLPPSLAVILYGVVAHVPIPDLFVAGIVPGALMVGAVCLFGAASGVRLGVPRTPFRPVEALAAAWQAKWDLLLPPIVLAGIFGGLATLVEAAALAVVYAFAVECLVHRELGGRALPRLLRQCATLFGGIFVIIGVAMGLTNYLIDAEVPARLAEWTSQNVGSRFLFLLLLNLGLLVVGCLMDIFSAIVVVVPLIVPVAELFGVAPLHLAMVFLINLELGYLTPPVGMNLFLAAMRFRQPLVTVCRSVAPFAMVLLGVLLLVTYVPGLILGVE